LGEPVDSLLGRVRVYVDDDGWIMKKEAADGKTTPTGDKYEWVRFPIRIGGRWSFDVQSKTVTGRVAYYSYFCQAAKWETISIGTQQVRAVRINCGSRNRDSGGVFGHTVWYSPEAKWIVRLISDYQGGPTVQVTAWGTRSEGVQSATLTPPAPVPDAPSNADREPPKIVLNYPPEGAKAVQEQITVLALITDNVAVDRVLVSVNGRIVAIGNESAITERSHSIRTSVTLQLGENVIEVTAVDKAGNASQVVRTVTRGAPTVAVQPQESVPAEKLAGPALNAPPVASKGNAPAAKPVESRRNVPGAIDPKPSIPAQNRVEPISSGPFASTASKPSAAPEKPTERVAQAPAPSATSTAAVAPAPAAQPTQNEIRQDEAGRPKNGSAITDRKTGEDGSTIKGSAGLPFGSTWNQFRTFVNTAGTQGGLHKSVCGTPVSPQGGFITDPRSCLCPGNIYSGGLGVAYRVEVKDDPMEKKYAIVDLFSDGTIIWREQGRAVAGYDRSPVWVLRAPGAKAAEQIWPPFVLENGDLPWVAVRNLRDPIIQSLIGIKVEEGVEAIPTRTCSLLDLADKALALTDANIARKRDEVAKAEAAQRARERAQAAARAAQEAKEARERAEAMRPLIAVGAFQIAGKIIDRDERGVMLWGRAIPVDGDYTRIGTNTKEANLAVRGAQLTNPMAYTGYGCYVGREIGTNAMGARVPVWVYRPCP
jgi:hypothetical protein